MKADRIKSYRFSTSAQWGAGLLVAADPDSVRKSQVVRPFAPYAPFGTLVESGVAHAPVVSHAGDILWRDDRCKIHRLTECDDAARTTPAPAAFARAKRIVATRSGLWVLDNPVPEYEGENSTPERKPRFKSLRRFEEETLSTLLTFDIPDGPGIDIASDGQDSVLILVEREGKIQSVRLDRRGHVVETIEFKGISEPEAFVFLRRAQKFIVLAGNRHSRLYGFPAKGGPAQFSLAVAGLRPCFKTNVLGGDSRDRVFLAGAEADEFGGRAHILVLDADGNRLGELPLDSRDSPATGIAASRDCLYVTGRRGLLRFKVAEHVPVGAEQVQCKIMTPSLFSSDREDRRRWLRVDARASLPEGTSLEILSAATDDAQTRTRLDTIFADESFSASQRVANLLNEPGLWHGRTVFRGTGTQKQSPKTFSAKLFDFNERYLWVCMILTAAPGASLPHISELTVVYPGRTLMEDLPAIYQKAGEQPESFLRSLVGVLETTTQGLDARIGSLGRQVHPTTAQEIWLDFIAGWLGVPWDDALTPQQKRSMVMRASDLAKGRGTRAGLETLLDILIPGQPRRFRVTDPTADFGFAVVGGGSCTGSSLPAMLGGRSRWNAELNFGAVLGYTRLPGVGQHDDGIGPLAGKVRVEVAATAVERKAWEPWLLALVTDMVPLGVRLELQWVPARALRANRLDGTMTLDTAPAPHLGTDAITGEARLPEQEPRLSGANPIIGARLQ